MSNQLTGKIRQGEHVIVFTSDEYRFTLISVDGYKDSDGYYSPVILRPDNAGYVWGVTSEQKVVAIFIKEDICIHKSQVINTWNYNIFSGYACRRSDGAWDEGAMLDTVPLDCMCSEELSRLFRFSGIEFTNGFVGSVNPCKALHEDYDLEKRIIDSEELSGESACGVLVYKVSEDSKRYSVDVDGNLTVWRFESAVSQRSSINKGESLANDKSTLTIEFKSEQDLKTFYDYFGYVSNILAFLTYRKNVYFESIKLLAKHPKYGFCFLADCHVKYESTALVRDMVRVVSVKTFTDDIFRKLVIASMNKAGNSVGLPVGIIPKKDDDVALMTTDRIRSICSALESEINATGIKSARNEELECLINEVKEVIKTHRDQSEENHKLPDKTYENIFSSIGHWSDSAADRFINAWRENEDLKLTGGWDIDVSDKDIEEFVKIRNRITHSGQRELTEQIARTGIALTALVYALALHRLGVSRESVRTIMEHGLIW